MDVGCGDGFYFEGPWQKGQRICFLTARVFNAVVGYVAEMSDRVAKAFALGRQDADYIFTDMPQGTKLTVDLDITEDFESMPEARPKALEKPKALCESPRARCSRSFTTSPHDFA